MHQIFNFCPLWPVRTFHSKSHAASESIWVWEPLFCLIYSLMIRHGVTNLDLPSYKGQTFIIKKIIQHPKYIGTAYFDIAVLLIHPIKFQRHLTPICLPDPFKFEIDQVSITPTFYEQHFLNQSLSSSISVFTL